MKKLSTLSLLFFVTFLVSCGNKKDKKAEENVKTDSIVTNPPVTEKGVKLICKDLQMPDSLNPKAEVYLSVDGVQTMISTIITCEQIDREKYEEMQIPKEAIAACGGWYAGGGDYYYVIMRDGKPVVFEGAMEEMQEDNNYHWKEKVIK